MVGADFDDSDFDDSDFGDADFGDADPAGGDYMSTGYWSFDGRDSRLPLFGQGRAGERAAPNAWQVMVVDEVSGADGSCPGASDDEVLGILGQWESVDCWVESRKLAVVRELIRRRPDPEAVGEVTGSGLPPSWDDDLAREVSLQLGLSVVGARKLIDLAWSLEARLPRIGDALSAGRLRPAKARMIVEETGVLADPGHLAQAERIILAGLAKCKTWSDLLRLAQGAVCTVDPEGARRRREKAERDHARIQFWRETSGACAVAGRELPADEALAAMANVEARAQEYRAAGVKRYIDILRVAAYLATRSGTAAPGPAGPLRARRRPAPGPAPRPPAPMRHSALPATESRVPPGDSDPGC